MYCGGGCVCACVGGVYVGGEGLVSLPEDKTVFINVLADCTTVNNVFQVF